MMLPFLQDRPHESCGVFGIFSTDPSLRVAHVIYDGLFGLQHRGQESAGIVVSDGSRLYGRKGMGLVREVFDETLLSELDGHLGIGHTRYSTTGSSSLTNAQPISAHCSLGQIAVSHNGNIANSDALLHQLQAAGAVFRSTTDTEILLNLMASSGKADLAEALRSACSRIVGSYSLAVLSPGKIIAIRDPMGNRPLCLGRLGNAYLVSSESCAIRTIGGALIRDVSPGEMVTLDEDGLHSEQLLASTKRAVCAMEHIYFARPDSIIDGRVVHRARQDMGRRLAQESRVTADVVIPIPDSGWSTAMGFAAEAGIPLDLGLNVNRYVGRTFIQPKQELRSRGVYLKLTPIEDVIRGKRVAIIDDSIVRGTTTRVMADLLREAGAREVHVYISSPPWKFPCYYGIDVPDRQELVAASHSIEEIAQLIGADSLHYLSVEGLWTSIGKSSGDDVCMACFTGDYPTEVVPVSGQALAEDWE